MWSIERHPELSATAGESLAAAGVANVTLLVGDGAAGHPAARPTTPSTSPPRWAGVPRALSDQLADGGRLVGPVNVGDQRLVSCAAAPGASPAPSTSECASSR